MFIQFSHYRVATSGGVIYGTRIAATLMDCTISDAQSLGTAGAAYFVTSTVSMTRIVMSQGQVGNPSFQIKI